MLLFSILVIFVLIGTWEVQSVGGKLEKKLESLENLLAAEFNKEKKYYEDEERSERQFEEWKKDTHGLGSVESMPRPAREPPAIVLAAEMLRSINSHLAYLPRLAEAVDKLADIDRNLRS
jgi:hypothetical protein